MELRVKKSALMLAMGVILALTSVGCGDDDDPVAGSGGTGATSGTGGTGGTGGGGVPTIAECVTDATAKTAGVLTILGDVDECLTCICTANVEKTDACNDSDDCWGLVNCSVVMCQGDMTCSVNMCTAFIGGYTPATENRDAVAGCADVCFPLPNMDAGTDDAGN